MNQESNPHSPSANFGEKVVDALLESFQDVEVTVQTNDSHFFIGGTPKAQVQGILICVIPKADSALDPGVLDLFRLGLKKTSVLRVLDNLSQETIYKTDDDSAHVWAENGSFHFAFRYTHSPGTWFNCSFDTAVSELLVKWFSYHSGAPRNAPCPCNSGKKFKRCCARQVPEAQEVNEAIIDLSGIPAEIQWIADIGNDDLKPWINSVIMAPSSLRNADYWLDLGSAVGTLGYSDRAMDCFKRALAINPKEHVARLNMAATLSAESLDNHDEALALIDEVPISTKRRSAVLANILADQGDGLDAIPHYELAIHEEPDYGLPYARLLTILNMNKHPLFEYWVKQAVRLLPSHPWVAYFYAIYLWDEKNFDELAAADWIDEVKVEVDYSAFGRPDYGREASRAQLLRQIAIVSLNRDRGLIKTLSGQIAGMDPSQLLSEADLCNEAKTLAFVCADEGYPEFISTLYDRICQNCIDEPSEATPRHVNTLLAVANCRKGNYEEAVSYFKTDLAEDSKSAQYLYDYSYALDEIGRTEEAISVAKRLYEIMPEYPYVAQNLGFMSQKYGRLGEAQYYYERELKDNPNLYSQWGLTFLLLLHQQVDEAERSLYKSFGMMRNPAIARMFWRPKLEYRGPRAKEQQEVKQAISKAEAGDFDEWSSLVNPQVENVQRVFDELVKFSKTNSDSPTFAKDLIEKNQSFGESKIGPDNTIKSEPYSITKILSATRHGEDESTYQSKFLMQLEQSGDFSVFQESLRGIVPRFDELPWTARASLLEGERRFISETPMLDHSPVVVSFAKAVEICLLQVVFAPYKSVCDAKVNISHQIEVSKENKKSQATSLFTFLERGQHLELGSMAHLLRLCNGRTAENEYLVGELRNFIRDELNGTILLDKENVETIGLIAKEFRNPGTHSDVLTKANAEECRRLCIDILQSLEPCIAEYMQAGSESN